MYSDGFRACNSKITVVCAGINCCFMSFSAGCLNVANDSYRDFYQALWYKSGISGEKHGQSTSVHVSATSECVKSVDLSPTPSYNGRIEALSDSHLQLIGLLKVHC